MYFSIKLSIYVRACARAYTSVCLIEKLQTKYTTYYLLGKQIETISIHIYKVNRIRIFYHILFILSR